MAQIDIEMEFAGVGYQGYGLNSEGYKIPFGEGGVSPYECLLQALGACFYANFIGIVEKKRLKFDKARLAVSGVKRSEIPAMLESCRLTVTLHGADPAERDKYEKSAGLADQYCSIYQTVSKVAEMSCRVEFV